MIDIKALNEAESKQLLSDIWPYLEPMIEARKAAENEMLGAVYNYHFQTTAANNLTEIIKRLEK